MSKDQANPFFQPKLTIGQPNDKYEQEADAVADAVVNQTTTEPVLQTKNISSIQRYMTNAEFDERGTNTERIEEDKRIQEKPEVQLKSMFESNEESTSSTVQRKCATCEKEEMVQKMEGEEEMINEKEESVQRKCATCEDGDDAIQPKAIGSGEMTASSSLQSQLSSSKGGGSALPDDTLSSMESSIGANFSGVRIHTDSSAVQMNKELGAQAFTHGSDVYFNSGKYDTSGKEGKRLLGHELTHVVQQSGSIRLKNQKIIQRVPSVPTPVNRLNVLAIFGDGTAANPGITLDEFKTYTRRQADWYVGLAATDRQDLWNLLLKLNLGGHISAGVGDLYLFDLRPLTLANWTALSKFGEACHAASSTVRIINASTYLLPKRIAIGNTLISLEAIIPGSVLELTVSEAHLNDVHLGGAALLVKLSSYWTQYHPHLEQAYGSSPRGQEFQKVLDIISGAGITPFVTLLGKVRNLHRFSVAMLTRLVLNFRDTTRARAVDLIIHTGHDAPAAFQDSAPLFEDLILNSSHLVLFIEGQASLASITSQIPTLANTYGQADGSGGFYLAQVMIAGHGEVRSVELAGAGGSSESLDLDNNLVATQALMDTLIQNLDPATARIVFAGCLVGSNRIPQNVTTSAGFTSHVNANPSLGTFTQQRATALGVPGLNVEAARASVALSAATSLHTSGTGDLHITYPFDPDAFGTASAYVATGQEPDGLLRAAVEVAATNPVAAANHLRTRLTAVATATDPWWDQCTLAFAKSALSGIAVGAGVSISRLNTLAHMVSPFFLGRFGPDFGVSPATYVSRVNTHSALASIVYTEIIATPTMISPSDLSEDIGRFLFEQGWLNNNGAREAPLILFLDSARLSADKIKDHLSVSAIASKSPTLFPVGAALTSGRIKLALAWLLSSPANIDVRAFLNNQVAVVSGNPTLSATVQAQLGSITQDDVLRALGRLAPTSTVVIGGRTVTRPNANLPIPSTSGTNTELVTIHPYGAVAARDANVRSRASFWGGRSLGRLTVGQPVNVVGRVGLSHLVIDFNGQTGFVFGSALVRNIPYRATAIRDVNVGSRASFWGSRSLGRLTVGQSVDVVGRVGLSYLVIDFNGQRGFVNSSALN